MQLGIRSPLRFGVSYDTWAGPDWETFNYMLLAGGMLFAAIKTFGIAGKLRKWANPFDLDTYTTLTFDNFHSLHGEIQSFIYDETTGYLYVAFNPYMDRSDDSYISVSRVDPATMTYTDIVDNYGPVGTNSFPQYSTCITTDGSSIYVATQPSSETSWIYQFDISDGTPLASRQLAQTYARRIQWMQSDGSRLYLAGRRFSGSPAGWCGWVELDLSGEATTNLGSTVDPYKYGTLFGDYFWLADGSNNNVVHRVEKSDLSAVRNLAFPFGSPVGGVVLEDGTLWGYTNSAVVFTFDPDTEAVTYSRAITDGAGSPTGLAVDAERAYYLGTGLPTTNILVRAGIS